MGDLIYNCVIYYSDITLLKLAHAHAVLTTTYCVQCAKSQLFCLLQCSLHAVIFCLWSGSRLLIQHSYTELQVIVKICTGWLAALQHIVCIHSTSALQWSSVQVIQVSNPFLTLSFRYRATNHWCIPIIGV